MSRLKIYDAVAAEWKYVDTGAFASPGVPADTALPLDVGANTVYFIWDSGNSKLQLYVGSTLIQEWTA
jgi:hypothetical protein